MKKISLFLLALGALFVGCEKDEGNNDSADTIKPVIVLSEPLDQEVYAIGSVLHLDGEVTDNTGLSELRIDIHYAGDGHSHGKRSSSWEWDTTVTISGREWKFHYDVDIPQAADSGIYHVMSYAIDAAGNQAEFVSRDIEIRPADSNSGGDLDAPVIQLTAPSHTGAADVSPGEAISINGQVTDNDHLEGIQIKLKRADNDAILEEIHLHPNDFDSHESHSLNSSVTVPSSTPTEIDLELEIEAVDEAGNKSHVHFDYHVH